MAKSWIKNLQNLFLQKKNTENSPLFWEELEDLLLEGDISWKMTQTIMEQLQASPQNLEDPAILSQVLKDLLSPYLLSSPVPQEMGKMNLYFILGINGAGKTTTIAKLAHWFLNLGRRDILLCAGDTFRAAAVAQLTQHAKEMGVRCVSAPSGTDPSSVLWNALESAKSQGDKIVLIDTAGRLHNKKNLIEELKKMSKVSEKVLGDTPFVQHNLLVIDANMGQNALQQAKTFQEALPLSGFILSKFDSTSRSGVVLSICEETKLPFFALGQGEKRSDLSPFDPERFLDKLLSPA